jgi:hypothetical protein
MRKTNSSRKVAAGTTKKFVETNPANGSSNVFEKRQETGNLINAPRSRAHAREQACVGGVSAKAGGLYTVYF